MIYLNAEIKEELIREARKEAPNEACGILAGKEGRVERIYPMKNLEESPVSFLMDPREQLKVMKEIRNLGLQMLAIYHSHPETRAYPSARDVELAFYPEACYIIVSLKEKDNPVIRGFRIVEGKITQEELRFEEAEEMR